MKNEMTICPPINGIGGLTDMEVFGCFNIEIDEKAMTFGSSVRFPRNKKQHEKSEPT